MADVMASPGNAAAAPDPRIAWANEVRKVVTRPDALNDDGSLNQQFFKPKKVVFATAGEGGRRAIRPFNTREPMHTRAHGQSTIERLNS